MNRYKIVWVAPNPEAPVIETGDGSKTFDGASAIASKLNHETKGSQGAYMVHHVMFMNIATGSVDNYGGWDYVNENGNEVNAVDLGEVVEVVKGSDGWEEI